MTTRVEYVPLPDGETFPHVIHDPEPCPECGQAPVHCTEGANKVQFYNCAFCGWYGLWGANRREAVLGWNLGRHRRDPNERASEFLWWKYEDRVREIEEMAVREARGEETRDA